MKRSEMIKLMDKYFDTRTVSSMDELLSIMEKLGMMPPRNPNITFTQQADHKTLHIWEDEKEDQVETILGGKVKFTFIRERQKSFYGDKVFDGTFVEKVMNAL